MKISYNWLKQYLNLSINPEEVADILTSTGLEVEGVSQIFSSFDHLVVGKVLECFNHPDADRLKITKVDVGSSIKQIICGAKNVKKGQYVVVVLPGNTLTNIKGDSFKIKKTKIRGEWSEGMICGEDEIGLGYNHEGIMELPNDCEVGNLVSNYFQVKGDQVFEIGLTPNRTDAFGHIGVCRDLYAYLIHRSNKLNLSIPDITAYQAGESSLSINLDNKSADVCEQYYGVCIDNVTVQSSPMWLQSKLISIGLKPINNIVDITNYVLHETGSPLHAYDYAKITSSNLIIRKAKQNELFVALDSKELSLSDDNLVICDSEKPLCLAGVIGGNECSVNNTTQRIFLESAFFNAASIRKTSKQHGILSDSSYRFERGVDFSNCLYALHRAALLIKEICGGIIGQEVSFSTTQLQHNEIDFSYKYCVNVLGHKVDKQTILSILKSLDFDILANDNDIIKLKVPSFRVDVKRPIDVVEEISRIYGYDNLPESKHINFQPFVNSSFSNNDIQIQISNLLVSNGFFEIQNNSLVAEKTTRFTTNNLLNPVKLLNPLSNDLAIMRTNMFSGVLNVVHYNLNRQNHNLKLFEFGKVYGVCKDNQYHEKEHLTICVTGVFKGGNWHDKARKIDFFFIKGILDQIIKKSSLSNSHLSMIEQVTDYSSLGLSYLYQDEKIAECGIFSDKFLKFYDIKKDVYFIDIYMDSFFKFDNFPKIRYNPVLKFPSIRRDLSLLIDQSISFEEIKNLINSLNIDLLKNIDLFDVYIGDNIEKDKKSYSLSFLFQHKERTLTDDEVDKEMKLIYKTLNTKLDISLREGEL
ncbi:MAG: phenylalanine--tRNA ligase subunit beta [Flavobacteriales bacterium]|nr:phenylalanine--tRNA ligase subunit beta [Flavobacteriales bacterium]